MTDITPAERRMLAALARAAIDPGELLFRELVVRLRPTPLQVAAATVDRLAGKGLITVEGRDGALRPYDTVRLTRAGADVVNALGLPWAVRT